LGTLGALGHLVIVGTGTFGLLALEWVRG